jgi:hypothetical protein
MWVVRDYVRWADFGRFGLRLALAAAIAVAAGVAFGTRLAFPLGPVLVVAALGAASHALRLISWEDVRQLVPRGRATRQPE